MTKKVSSKQKIIETAMSLFHMQGIHKTGIDEILRESATGKGQFYHYFDSKDDLVHEVMHYFLLKLKSGTIPVTKELKTWKDLEQWFFFFIEAQKGMGCKGSCPIATIAAELSTEQDLLRKEACRIFDYSRQPLIDFFRVMKDNGKLIKSTDPRSLTDFCYSIMQGGLIVAKIQRNSTPFENAVKHALHYINSLKIE